ncbi:MAG TPA: DUF4336 domain-containing protein [Nitrosospira sp.]|jgi:hypothetical protein|nr:DUF4336 domain-containing protein [Nitrosospira sp.]
MVENDGSGNHGVYPPLNVLKPVAQNLWIVDGPVIRFGLPWPKIPFPTRMTIIRLACGELLIHSPTCLTPSLKTAVEKLGIPRWIVGPNRIHYWWIPDWKSAYPAATVYLAPLIKEQAANRIDFDFTGLDHDCGYPWDGEIATLPVKGKFMTEIEFFHYPSRTLLLTDLIENFEPEKLDSFLMRGLTWLGGVQDPDGKMPRDMRRTFSRKELRKAIQKMIQWDPVRIVLAHGRWYEENGVPELRRAFRWLLDEPDV